MILEPRPKYSPPRSSVWKWLTNPGSGVPQHIRDVLLGELFTSPAAVVAGVLNGVLLNVVALILHGGLVFLLFLALDAGLGCVRVHVLRRTRAIAAAGGPTPTDFCLFTGVLWCALQGVVAFVAMRTDNGVLQILSATTVMGLTGPICVRNYAAPRLALLLVCLCDFPLVAGAAFDGRPWLLVLVLQTPLLLFSSISIITRFQSMAVDLLQAQHDSHHHARHDYLTGLLNRFGLMEILSRRAKTLPRQFVLFYLDLDGFKQVNDRLGHQAGDELLRAAAQRLRSSVRAGDIVARLGGDEFVVVAPGMSPGESGSFANGIIRRVSDQPYEVNAGEFCRIGVSVRFACAPDDGTVMEELHRKADAALYLVKAAGKGVQRRCPAASPECAVS
jgi:diguanylate cyclase (GGDEF)-like protein